MAEEMDMEMQIEGPEGRVNKSGLRVFIRKNNWILGVIAVALFMAVWEYIGTSGMINPLFTSAPSRVFRSAVKVVSNGTIWNHMRVSAIEFAVAYGLAMVVGIGMGMLIGWYRFFHAVCDPFISVLNATPRIAFMSLLIIWFGIGIWSKVAVIFLGAVFPILVNTTTGIRTVDAHLLTAARSFGARDKEIFTTVALPASVPHIITGLRLGVGRALIGVVVGEMYAATAGVGYLITTAGATFQTDLVFVGVVIIAGTGITSMNLLKRLEKKFESWRPQIDEG